MSETSSPTSSPTQSLIKSATLIKQGAEAKVYRSPALLPTLPDLLLKYRFPKTYRHATLDAQLTRSRILAEARALAKAGRAGVKVPGVRMVDADAGVLGIEWIEGRSVREWLGGGAEGEVEGEEDEEGEVVLEEDGPKLADIGMGEAELMDLIGVQLARLHAAELIHGDLTTSNLLLVPSPPTLYLIDFGLSSQVPLSSPSSTEDRAVDLYVLERAFASTHPGSAEMFERVLQAYAKEAGTKEWKSVGRKLEDVRMRGRKRSMVG